MTNGKDTISREEVRAALQNRELRHNCSGASDKQAVGLVASSNQRFVETGKKKFPKRQIRKGPKPDDVCNYCKEKGHWKTDCPKKRQEQQRGVSDGTVAIANDSMHYEEDMALVAVDDTFYTDVWILDSGASYHMCPRREWFSTYEQLDGGIVSMANGSSCKVVGIGSVRIRMHDGRFCTLNEVRHVPHLTKNLLSLSRLDKRGFSFRGEGGGIAVYSGSDVILRGVRRGTLYVLQGRTFSGSDCCGVGKQVELRESEVSSESEEGTSRSLSEAITSVASRASMEHHKVTLECPERVTAGVPYERYDYEDELAFAFLVAKELDSHGSSVAGTESIQWQAAIGEEVSSLQGSDDHMLKRLLGAASEGDECMLCVHTGGIEGTDALVYTSSQSGSSCGVDVVSSGHQQTVERIPQGEVQRRLDLPLGLF